MQELDSPAKDARRLTLAEITVLCLLALVADLFFAGLTALVVAYADALHITLAATGLIASIEGGGFALGTLLVAVVPKLNQPSRHWMAVMLVFLAAAQGMSALATTVTAFSGARLLAGVGAGMIIALGTTVISRSIDNGRAFAVYFGTLFVAGMVGLPAISHSLVTLGFAGTYWVYGGLILVSLAALAAYPRDTCPVSVRGDALLPDRRPEVRIAMGLLITSVILNFVFNGGIWVLAEEYGLRIPGTTATSLSTSLAATMSFGILGTAAATVFNGARHRASILVMGSAVLVISVIVLGKATSTWQVLMAMALLNFAVTFATPAALSASAEMSDRGAQWMNLATQAGYSLGPGVIALLETHVGTGGVVVASVAGFVLAAVLAVAALRPPLLMRRASRAP